MERLYLVDVGYGRGYLGINGSKVPIEESPEWTWSQAISLVHSLRRRGYTGAEAVPVTVITEQPIHPSQELIHG